MRKNNKLDPLKIFNSLLIEPSSTNDELFSPKEFKLSKSNATLVLPHITLEEYYNTLSANNSLDANNNTYNELSQDISGDLRSA